MDRKLIGEHVGSIVFSDEEGVELFRCPAYIRILSADIRTLETQVRAAIRAKYTRQTLRQLFKEFDENGNGLISRAEFRSALESLGLDLSREQIQVFGVVVPLTSVGPSLED
jgi:hypothetical protein